MKRTLLILALLVTACQETAPAAKPDKSRSAGETLAITKANQDVREAERTTVVPQPNTRK